jgi:DNA repair exonuclease SbcCD ATPase subunit
MPLIGAVGARSTLREAVRKLGVIRVACGKGETEGHQQVQLTGDAFGDRLQWFKAHANECREAINDRTEVTGSKTPEDRTEYVRADAQVLRALDKMDLDLKALEKLVGEANDALYAAVQKRSTPEKIEKKQQVFNERNAAHGAAVGVHAQLKKLSRSAKEETLTASAASGKSKTRIRNAMETLRRASAQNVDVGTAQTLRDLESVGPGGAPYGDNPPALENSEFRDQYLRIQQQKKEIDRGLDRLSEAITSIRDKMVNIGDELETQNQMLVATQERVAKQTEQVRNLRKQVDMVLKKQAPMNMCINVFCFILLLALVGYFLVKFKVV